LAEVTPENRTRGRQSGDGVARKPRLRQADTGKSGAIGRYEKWQFSANVNISNIHKMETNALSD